jgi:hypothetical protein
MVGRYKKTGFMFIFFLCCFLTTERVYYEIREISTFSGEIAIEVTGVVGVSPALWYFRYIASIFLTLHKRLWVESRSRATYFGRSRVLSLPYLRSSERKVRET